KKEVTLEEVMASKMVSYPLKLYDCSPISDGSAALILASEEKASELSDKPVYFLGLGAGTDTATLYERDDLTGLKATREAAKQAYQMACVKPQDIDLADVHDCFTIAEIMAYEDLGFCKKGDGGKFIEEKRSYLEGDTPVNVDGGLKAKGHPLGATGVGMVYEITKQLRGEAGPRQVKGAKIGLTHSIARDGTHSFVHIFGGRD
ncbi:MAG: thiolase domain-containing protein, partial [Methanobacteriota archaeon]